MKATKFKILLRIFFLTSICCMPCACQADVAKNLVQEQTNLPERQARIQAYLPIIVNSDIEDAAFSLIYLDDDAIPELVILDKRYDKYSVYTIKNNSVTCLIDSMTTVEMSYFERKNMISTFFRWNGGGDEGGYAVAYYKLDQYSETLTDDSIPSFRLTYNAVYDKSGKWTGKGVTDYYQKGKKITETTYHQIFSDFNISPDDGASCFSENNQCFTKDEILMYLDAKTTRPFSYPFKFPFRILS